MRKDFLFGQGTKFLTRISMNKPGWELKTKTDKEMALRGKIKCGVETDKTALWVRTI